MLHFLQIEGKTLHQQKDYELHYCGGLEPKLQYLRGVLFYRTFLSFQIETPHVPHPPAPGNLYSSFRHSEFAYSR